MSAATKVKWIKLAVDILSDEKMVLLDTMPEADMLFTIWVKLLCLAGQSNCGGALIFRDKIPYTDEMLAAIFRRPVGMIRVALEVFEKFGMIELVEDTVMITHWDDHQSVDELEKIKASKLDEQRERAAERTRRCRENKKLKALEGTTEEPVEATDYESEFEEIWKLYPRKEGKKKSLASYTRARKKGVSMDEIKAGVERYRQHIAATKTDQKYVKHGSTWFAGQCWQDEYETGGNSNDKGTNYNDTAGLHE